MKALTCVAGLAVLIALPASEARASLLSSWNFDETTGTTAFDSVGSVNGTLAGNAAFVTGGVNGSGAVSMNQAGGGGYVDMGDNFNFSGAYSLEAWVQLTATNGQLAVGRHHATEVAGYFIGVNNTGDGCAAGNGQVHFYSEYPCSGPSPTLVNDGSWHQLVATFSGGVASIYVDGQFQSASSGTVLNPVAGVHFMVGGIFDPSYNPVGVYTGLIDNVSVWDNALSASDVQERYASAAAPEPGTIAMMLGGALALGALRRRKKAR